jgi:hypothetical protein
MNKKLIQRCKFIIFFQVIMLCFLFAEREIPDWSVNPSDYQYTGSIIAAVYNEGLQVGVEGDLVAAFVVIIFFS